MYFKTRFPLFALLAVLGLTGTPAANAADMSTPIPDYMKVIVGSSEPNPVAIARDNVLALNTGMFELYGEAGQLVQRHILAQHPIILGLFSGAGGRFILYRPGQLPVEGPPVPEVYQLLKSIGHSVMALGVVVGPHIGKPEDRAWKSSLAAYRVRLKAALAGIDTVTMPDAWRANNRVLLETNIGFIDKCLADGVISFSELQEFATKQKALLKLNIKWAAETQVKHWFGVLAGWKQLLGAGLGPRLRSEQHDLRGAPEQRSVQHFSPVFRTRRHQLASHADRDSIIHYDTRGYAGVSDQDYLRPSRR